MKLNLDWAPSRFFVIKHRPKIRWMKYIKEDAFLKSHLMEINVQLRAPAAVR
jgi:hypothetical protein